jgi:DNA-binding XRE family transcriptional regulator
MIVTFIERDGRCFALVPAEIYERMLDDLDDLDDVRLYDAAKGKPQEYVPAAVVDRIIAGENPVTVWREHRGLSVVALAKAVEISPPYLSQIEHSQRQPSLDVLRRLAHTLGVDIDDLVTGDP